MKIFRRVFERLFWQDANQAFLLPATPESLPNPPNEGPWGDMAPAVHAVTGTISGTSRRVARVVIPHRPPKPVPNVVRIILDPRAVDESVSDAPLRPVVESTPNVHDSNREINEREPMQVASNSSSIGTTSPRPGSVSEQHDHSSESSPARLSQPISSAVTVEAIEADPEPERVMFSSGGEGGGESGRDPSVVESAGIETEGSQEEVHQMKSSVDSQSRIEVPERERTHAATVMPERVEVEPAESGANGMNSASSLSGESNEQDELLATESGSSNGGGDDGEPPKRTGFLYSIFGSPRFRNARIAVGGTAATAVLAVVAVMSLTGDSSAEGPVDVLRAGEAIYLAECSSCHGAGGDRLPIAPLNSAQFLAERGDATLIMVVAEGKSIMPAYGLARGGPLDENDIRSVVAYMNSLAGRDSTSLLAAQGESIYNESCTRCHGVTGDRIPVAPLNAKGFLDRRSNADLRTQITDGGNTMPPFGDANGGPLSITDIDSVIAFLRHRVDERTASIASTGRDIYVTNCLQCHGPIGDRIPAADLKSPDFLETLGDGNILLAINEGTEVMPAYGAAKGGSFGIPELASMLAYLKANAGLNSSSALKTAGFSSKGEELFIRNCSACHAGNGQGVPGVKLFSSEFLAGKTDTVLLDTITNGNGKGMPAWGLAAGGPLSENQIAELLAFLKEKAGSAAIDADPTPTPEPDTSGSDQQGSGDQVSITAGMVDHGREIFESTCTLCHGATRDAIPTCRLTEQDFFHERGDDALTTSIRDGRGAMPAWGSANGGPLSDEDIQDVLAYLKVEVGVAEIGGGGSGDGSNGSGSGIGGTTPLITPELVSSGREVFSSSCAVCHGETRDKVPTCELTNPDWLIAKGFDGLINSVTNGKPPLMPAWGENLSPENITAVVAFLLDEAGVDPAQAGSGTGVVAAPEPTHTPAAPVEPITTPNLNVGREIFTGTCAMCHGQDGLNIPQCPVGSREWISNMSEEGLIARISRGKPSSGMPAWSTDFDGPLSDAEIKSVALYLGSVAR